MSGPSYTCFDGATVAELIEFRPAFALGSALGIPVVQNAGGNALADRAETSANHFTSKRPLTKRQRRRQRGKAQA